MRISIIILTDNAPFYKDLNMKISSCAFLAFILTSSAFAMKSQFSIDTSVELDQWQQSTPKKSSPSFFTTISQNLEWSPNFNCSLELSAKSYSRLYKSQEETISEVVPRDFGCQSIHSGMRIFAGFTKIDWTQNLGFQIGDLFTAFDFRRTAFLEEKDKYSVPMLRLDYFTEQTTTTLLISSSISKNYYSSDRLGFTSNTLINFEDPSSPDIGGRFATNNSLMDWQISIFTLSDRDPQFTIQNTINNLLEHHYKYTILNSGASVKAFGGMLRADIDFALGRSFTSAALTTFKSDELIFVVGYETPLVWNTIFSLQYTEAKLQDSTFSNLNVFKTDIVALKANYSAAQKDSFAVLGFENMQDSSSGLRVEYSWNIHSAVDLHLGAEFYNGRRGSFLESYLDQNKIFLSASSKIIP